MWPSLLLRLSGVDDVLLVHTISLGKSLNDVVAGLEAGAEGLDEWAVVFSAAASVFFTGMSTESTVQVDDSMILISTRVGAESSELRDQSIARRSRVSICRCLGVSFSFFAPHRGRPKQ